MGPTGGVGQGLSTPVSIGSTGLAPSQAHELVNGTFKNLLFSPSQGHSVSQRRKGDYSTIFTESEANN